MYNPYDKYSKARATNGLFSEETAQYLVIIALLIGTAGLILGIISLATTPSTHWERETKNSGNIISKHQGVDVQVKKGSNLIIDKKIISCETYNVVERTNFTPAIPIFPPGEDFIFGDQSIPYARLQSGSSIGFRLGTNSSFMPSGVLFGEPDLKVLLEPWGLHVASAFFPFFGIFFPSDERIKTNIADMDINEAFRNVMNLEPRIYNYIDEWNAMQGKYPVEERRGFIAQEVEEVLPNSITETKMNIKGEVIEDFKDLRKDDIITELVGAFQEMTYANIVNDVYNNIELYELASQISGTEPGLNKSTINELRDCMDAQEPMHKETVRCCICQFLEGVCPCENPNGNGCRLCNPSVWFTKTMCLFSCGTSLTPTATSFTPITVTAPAVEGIGT
jgi:hypothetical protein